MRRASGSFRSRRLWAGSLGAAVVLVLAGLVGGARASAAPFVAVDLQIAGGDFGEALAVSDGGQVVGSGNLLAGRQPRAFSWTRSGGMVGLGDQTDEAVAVNDSGQVVAQSDEFDEPPRSFSWTEAGGLVDIGVLGVPPPCPVCSHGGASTTAHDVNEHGQIVGGSTTAAGAFHAYVWTHAGGMIDLGTLGSSFSEAAAINDSGQVVGRSATAGGETHPFSWTQAGGMIDLGTFGGTFSYAVAVNGSGQVVGTSGTADGSSHAFSWTQAGGLVDLGTLGGRGSTARAVSDTGQVVGSIETADGQVHGFSWTAAGGMVDLGREAEFPQAVNDHGEVVGYSFHADDTESAFSWTQAGGLVALPSLGGPQSDAQAVNDDGVIVGASITGSGDPHATLWQPQHDSTPPALSVPADLTVPATGPNGATVAFQASALDAVDGSVPVSCTAASGSLFPIGDTQVTCTASDSSGNTASAGFTIHVESAAEQLADLAGAAPTVGPGSSLTRKVAAARAALDRDNLSATCGVLRALHNELKGGALDADVLRISAVLRC